MCLFLLPMCVIHSIRAMFLSWGSAKCTHHIIIIIIIIIITYLLTEIEFSLGGSSPYNSTDATIKNKYT